MFDPDRYRRIKELESQLISEDEKYVNAVRLRNNYHTLRTHRENMRNIENAA
jgi:hypothetical protein